MQRVFVLVVFDTVQSGLILCASTFQAKGESSPNSQQRCIIEGEVKVMKDQQLLKRITSPMSHFDVAHDSILVYANDALGWPT